MAGQAVIGALRVVIGADSAALDKGLSDARGSLQKFGSDVATAGAVIGVALTAAFAAVSLGINGALDKMEGFAKQSQKIDIPVEKLSALSLAADLSNVSMEQLQTGLGKLSKAMVDAAAKPTSEAANAFRALGIQATDSNGKLLPVADVTQTIAGKFENLKDGAGKTAISMALFGKSGAELIPLLNMGRDGLQGMMDNAEKFGIVIDSKTAAAADHFRDSLKLLGAAKDGIIIKLTAFLLPAMQQFADRMLANASNTDKQAGKLDVLKTVFEGVARALLLVVDNFGALLKIGAIFVGAQIAAAVLTMIVAFVNMARAIQAAGLMMAAFEAIRAIGTKGILVMVGLIALATGQFENLAAAVKEIGAKIGDALPQGAGEAFGRVIKSLGFDLSALSTDLTTMGGSSDKANKKLGELNYSALAGKTAFDQYINSVTKGLAGQQADFDSTNMASGAKERLKTVLEGLQVATANNLPITEAMRAKLTETANAADLMALKLGNVSLIGQANPFLALQANLDATNLKLQQGGLATQDYATLSSQSALLTSKIWQQAGSSMGQSFESIGTSLSQLGSNWGRMAAIGKAIGATIAFINSYVAASQALATAIFPANIAIAAGVLANGLAMVAAIRGAAIPSAATGGAFRVAGGTGGGDSKLVQMALEPGELVQVSSNRANGYQAGGAREITVRGMGLSDLITGKQLIEALNKAIGDGGRVALA